MKTKLFAIAMMALLTSSAAFAVEAKEPTLDTKDHGNIFKWVDIGHYFRFGTYRMYKNENTSMYEVDYGVSFSFFRIMNYYYFTDMTLSSSITLSLDDKHGHPRAIPGFGIINYGLRLHLIPIPIIRSTVFVEGTVGLVAYARKYPDGGTIFNGGRHIGAGVEHFFKDGGSFFVSFRWFHTSNNNALGRNRNPGLNAIGLSFGFKSPILSKYYHDSGPDREAMPRRIQSDYMRDLSLSGYRFH